ncbi:MAG TPA: hypothetical protein VFH01_04270 [Pyrinomonadaceae bacterium]|nr:hypothetical protein [Pyrinomonadaceae bacterium]
MCQKQSTKKVRILLMIEADTMNVPGSYCVLFFCYHAATRTGQLSPIYPHVGSMLVCGFSWGYLV